IVIRSWSLPSQPLFDCSSVRLLHSRSPHYNSAAFPLEPAPWSLAKRLWEGQGARGATTAIGAPWPQRRFYAWLSRDLQIGRLGFPRRCLSAGAAWSAAHPSLRRPGGAPNTASPTADSRRGVCVTAFGW